jgi:hypothetical protein
MAVPGDLDVKALACCHAADELHAFDLGVPEGENFVGSAPGLPRLLVFDEPVEGIARVGDLSAAVCAPDRSEQHLLCTTESHGLAVGGQRRASRLRTVHSRRCDGFCPSRTGRACGLCCRPRRDPGGELATPTVAAAAMNTVIVRFMGFLSVSVA